MNPLLKALLAALNLPATEATTEAQALGAVAALKAAVPAAISQALGLAAQATEAEVATAAAALKATADTAAADATQIAALKAGGNPDPSKWVGLDRFTELATQVATLSASSIDRTVDELINAAKGDGKCSPVVETVWRDIGKVSVAQLKALIEKTPANPALAGLSQTAGREQQSLSGPDSLNAEQKAMCKSLGLKAEDYLATLKSQAAAA